MSSKVLLVDVEGNVRPSVIDLKGATCGAEYAHPVGRLVSPPLLRRLLYICLVLSCCFDIPCFRRDFVHLSPCISGKHYKSIDIGET